MSLNFVFTLMWFRLVWLLASQLWSDVDSAHFLMLEKMQHSWCGRVQGGFRILDTSVLQLTRDLHWILFIYSCFLQTPNSSRCTAKRRWTPKQSGHMWWDDMEPGIVTPWLLICCSNSLQPSVFSPSSRSSSCCRDFLPFRHCSDTFPASLFHTSLFNFTVFLNIM